MGRGQFCRYVWYRKHTAKHNSTSYAARRSGLWRGSSCLPWLSAHRAELLTLRLAKAEWRRFLVQSPGYARPWLLCLPNSFWTDASTAERRWGYSRADFAPIKGGCRSAPCGSPRSRQENRKAERASEEKFRSSRGGDTDDQGRQRAQPTASELADLTGSVSRHITVYTG